MIQELDQRLFHFLYQVSLDHEALGSLMVHITQLSSLAFAAAYFACILHLSIRKNPRIVPFLCGPLSSFLLVHTIRHFYARPRPFTHLDIDSLIVHEATGSMPSMHSTSAFAIATAIFFLHKKAGAAAFILATLTALSRVMVGVHFPLDILLGAILSILLTIVFFKACTPSPDTPSLNA